MKAKACCTTGGITEIHTHTHMHTHRHTDTHTCLSFSWNVLPLPPPPSSPTRRGGSPLQCQKSHPRAPTTTRLWPETAHWRAQRNSGRRPENAWWLPRELRPYGKTPPRRAPTASRSTSPRLRPGYEDTDRDTHQLEWACSTHKHTHHTAQKCMAVHTNVQCTRETGLEFIIWRCTSHSEKRQIIIIFWVRIHEHIDIIRKNR